jgi:hypothetical protein
MVFYILVFAFMQQFICHFMNTHVTGFLPYIMEFKVND